MYGFGIQVPITILTKWKVCIFKGWPSLHRGAGFIGSNLVDRLLRDGDRVVSWDNFSTGQKNLVAGARVHKNYNLVRGDTLDLPSLTAALALSSMFGFIIASFSFLLMAIYLFYKLMGWEILWGNPTLVILISFLGSIQLISVGILGEYIGRIYEEVWGRPKFIVDRAEGFEHRT